MTPQQWEEVKCRFHEALQQPAEARRAFLLRECSDETIRREAERLLLEDRQAGDFLGRSAMEPSQIDRYRILSLLGSGGIGVVYRAQDPLLGRNVALKLLLDKFTGDETALRRFRAEGRALSALNHRNICAVHDIGEAEGRTFIVMEYVPGTRLDELIRGKSMQPADAIKYALQIAAGLEKAHAAEIIHRDLKPCNIMVTGEGEIKLLDFGVAKLIPSAEPRHSGPDESVLTVEGAMVGTPAYMSPEQAETKPIDARSDIFSFGAVLYEMITGQRAFKGASRAATLSAVLYAEPGPVSNICPSVPLELDRIVARCLCKNPDGRVQTASALRASLQELSEATGSDVRRSKAYGISRKARIRIAAIAISAILLIAIAWAAIGMRGMKQSPEALPGEKRIAILPLDVIGKDETVQTLADGLVETLTSKLAQIEDFQGKLMVVPASEVREQKIRSVAAARRIYGANLVITGSAQRWNDRIQFTLNLVEAATVRQIASRTFEYDATKPTTLRDEAVNGAVQLLKLNLTTNAWEFIAAGETSTPGAYEEYLKGVGYLARYDQVGNSDKAIQSLTQATRLDGHYAVAFAALGKAYWLKAKMKGDAREKELALESIREAIRLDPDLAKAHVLLGEIYSKNGQMAQAEQEEQSALRKAPGDAEAYKIMADVYATEGRYAQAETALREGVRGRPGDWQSHLQLGIFYASRGRNAEARAQFEAALNITPDNEIVYRNLSVLDMAEGKFRQASDNIVKELRFEKNSRTYVSLGAAYYYQRRFAEAADALNAGIKVNPGNGDVWGNLGAIYQHLPGNEDKAREAFHKAIELSEKRLKVTPLDSEIHANLAEYWARLGDAKKSVAQIEYIPKVSREKFTEQIVLVYELTGNHRLAKKLIQSLSSTDSKLVDMRNDPDLESLWRDPELHRLR
jgi:eukaryotic-like serine/threonine-protein kinase